MIFAKREKNISHLEKTFLEQNSLREQKLKLRGEMSPSEVNEASGEICRRLFELQEYINTDILYSYCPVRNEVDIMPVNLAAQKTGKRVFLPKTKGQDISFYEFLKDTNLIPGAFGVPEPDTKEPYDGTLGLMLVPGVVFSKEGLRIGFGKGYYDRYLDTHPMIVTVGIAYEFQVEESFCTKNSDIPMDIIVTEKGIYR